jgi:hypothetical protein
MQERNVHVFEHRGRSTFREITRRPSRWLRVTRAGARLRLRNTGSSTCVYALEAPSRRASKDREVGERGTRGYAHDAETTRCIVARRVCIMPTRTRTRASFPVFGSHVAAALSTVTRYDTCQTNSEIFATPCTHRYLRPVRAPWRCRERE